MRELVSTKNNHLTVDYISLLCLKIAQLEEEIKKINDEKTKNDTEEIVKNAIKDILYDYSIKAIPKIINNGTDYKQIMKVMIYESNDLLFVYETEWLL